MTGQGMLPVGPDDWHLASHLFRKERLTLAREFRGLTKVELAARINKSASAISQFETGRTRPDVPTLAALQLVLQVPLAFFATSLHEPLLATDSAFFRSLRSATQKERRSLLAHGSIISSVVRELEPVVQFPQVQLPFLDVDLSSVVAIEAAADELRRHWNLGLGPIGSMVTLLEAHGIMVAEVPHPCAAVDAFSVRTTYRPLVFLVGSHPPSRSRFDAAHELGHLTIHADVVAESHDVESQAHRFGSAFLAPRESFLRECPKFLNFDHLYELKRRWGMSVQALVRRCYDLGVFSEATYRRAFVRLSQMGQRTLEPHEPPREEPSLLHQALALLPNIEQFYASLGISETLMQHVLGPRSDQ